MRYIEGVCKRCKESVKFDIGSMTYDKAIDKIKQFQSFECPGMHVYIAGIYDHYDWSEIKNEI